MIACVCVRGGGGACRAVQISAAGAFFHVAACRTGPSTNPATHQDAACFLPSLADLCRPHKCGHENTEHFSWRGSHAHKGWPA